MHEVIHTLSTWLSTALSVHIAIYEIYSEDTTGYCLTAFAGAGMMFVGSYRKVRASVSSDTDVRVGRYEHPRLPIRASAPSDTHRQRWSRDGYLWSRSILSIIAVFLSESNLKIQINEISTIFLINITKISFFRFFGSRYSVLIEINILFFFSKYSIF